MRPCFYLIVTDYSAVGWMVATARLLLLLLTVPWLCDFLALNRKQLKTDISKNIS